ncbi:hypothetical protein N500_0663 [Wolbachia pipientis wUni]|nr:hypothetical protein N500_0663 [Wolbachia pipientis wUni]
MFIPVSSTGMTLFSGGGCSQVTTFVLSCILDTEVLFFF